MADKFNTKRFTHKNDKFVCENCGRSVPPSSVSCRNHCPFCLCSKHVDVNPGDRANPCHGLMPAIGYELSGKKGLVLIFKCKRCGEVKKNIVASDGENTKDDYSLILKL